MNNKIFITGATGLIGREIIDPLLAQGFEVYAITRNAKDLREDVHWYEGDLFNSNTIKSILEEVKPYYLLNLAWLVARDNVNDIINFDYIKAGLDLLKYFHKNGGKHFVYAGTYVEYADSNKALIENISPIKPLTLYAQCKDYYNQLAYLYCKNTDISYACGRVFSAYGKETDARRLTLATINSLKNNEELVIHSGNLIRDYIYVKDVANAFVAILKSDIEGDINISTGIGTKLEDYVMLIAKKMQKEHLVIFDEKPSNQVKYSVGDNTRLTKEVGYTIQYDLDRALDEILEMSK